jgi:transposase
MPNYVSNEQRQAILDAFLAGHSTRKTAKTVGVSKVTVTQYFQIFRAEGATEEACKNVLLHYRFLAGKRKES